MARGTTSSIGCADHDGKAFPPNEYIITYTPGNPINCVNATVEQLH